MRERNGLAADGRVEAEGECYERKTRQQIKTSTFAAHELNLQRTKSCYI